MKKPVSFTLSMIVLGTTAFTPVKAQDELVYVAVDPCRIVDTREAGGAITANNFRNFLVSGLLGELAVQGGKTDCLDPKAGTGQKPSAISAYVITVPATSANSILTAYPSDQLPPPVGTGSTVNSASGQVIGNTTNITLCDPSGSCPTDGEFAILARNTDQHVVVDVQGYFYPAAVTVQPAQDWQTIVFPASANVHRESVMSVPTGKRLVLEYISVNYATTDDTVETRAIVEVSNIQGSCPQDPKMRQVLNVPKITRVSSTILNTIVSQPINLYAEPGEHICIHLNRSGDAVNRDVGVHLTGHYVDAP